MPIRCASAQLRVSTSSLSKGGSYFGMATTAARSYLSLQRSPAPGSCTRKRTTKGGPVKSEAELGTVVADYLRSLDWEVFQEVSAGPGGSSRADIVARKGRLLWIVELKKTFGFSVLAQADAWIREGMAHMVSVATPAPRRRGGDSAFRAQMARHIGCGWLRVREPCSWGTRHVEVMARPRVQRHVSDALSIGRFLHDAQKTELAAGSPGGGYWTPFRATMKAIQQTVSANPGIATKELIERVDHHYASDKSARHSIAAWVKAGRLEGVEARQDGRQLRFYPPAFSCGEEGVTDAD